MLTAQRHLVRSRPKHSRPSALRVVRKLGGALAEQALTRVQRDVHGTVAGQQQGGARARGQRAARRRIGGRLGSDQSLFGHQRLVDGGHALQAGCRGAGQLSAAQLARLSLQLLQAVVQALCAIRAGGGGGRAGRDGRRHLGDERSRMEPALLDVQRRRWW